MTRLRVFGAIWGLSFGLNFAGSFFYDPPARSYVQLAGSLVLIAGFVALGWWIFTGWLVDRRLEAEGRALIARIERRSKALQRFALQPPAIFHAACDMVSHNPHDVRNRYCAHCHVFLSDPKEYLVNESRLPPPAKLS
ncbi:MAG: hypothetical protein ACRDM7_17000 [Thermoleophilaceae bacterium]